MKNYIFVVIVMSMMVTGCSETYKGENDSRFGGVSWPSKTYYRSVMVNGYSMFYREAGDSNNPTVLLLHGYPSSSHTYRELIPMLSGDFHVIAPDNLGSGYSTHPDAESVTLTFDLLASQITGLLNALEVDDFCIYMQDFGAPVGFRVATSLSDRISCLVVQNANAYLEGLTPERQRFFMTAGDEDGEHPLESLWNHVSRDAIIDRQYRRDVQPENMAIMSPDAWTHDLAFLATDNDKRLQIQLFQDYRTNLIAYPEWQTWLRQTKPPILIVWGRADPVFRYPGAEAYLKDVPDAELHLLEAGHFALEEKPYEIARLMLDFLRRTLK